MKVDSGQYADLFNIARVSASNPDNQPNNNEASVVTQVDTIADLSLDKIAELSSAVPGSTFSYQIVVTNNGPSNAPHVVVNDTLPAALIGVTFNASQGSCSLVGPLSLVCDLGEIPANQQAVITIVGTVNPSATGQIVNTAWISNCGCNNDPNPSNDSDTVTTPVSPRAELELYKSATPTVAAGGTITYNLQVINHGPSTATNLVITDTLPVGVTPILASLPASCGIFAGTTVKCTKASLAAGAIASFSFQVTVAANVQPGSSLENVADVVSDVPDSNPLDNTARADTSIVSIADLSVNKTGPATVVAGNQIVYNVTVANQGPSVAQDVDLKDLLPAGVSYVGGQSTQGVCVSGICQLGDVAVGQTVSMVITGTVGSDVPAGVLTNLAQVFSDSPDPDPTDNSDTAVTTVTVNADVRVDKVDMKDPVGPTESFLYQIVVANDGPSDAQNVVVTDTLGPNLTFSAASPGCSYSAGKVTCTISKLAAGQSVSYLISVIAGNVPGGTILTNSVSVTSATPDSKPSNNQDTETTLVQILPGPTTDLSITKTANPLSVYAGEQVDYLITVHNAGPQIATNVRVMDLIPFGASEISMSVSNPNYPGAYCSGGGTCYLGTLNVGATATISVQLLVRADYQANTLVNTVTVMADQANSNTANNFASAQVTVGRRADLELTKVDLTDPVIAGANILYELKVTNKGPSDANNVTIQDTVPANTVFVSASNGCSLAGNVVTCPLGKLAAGASASVLLQVTAGQGLPNGTQVSNTATVSSTTTDPVMANNTDTEPTTINQSPFNPTDLEITKTDTPDPVVAGEILKYTLVVKNNGPRPPRASLWWMPCRLA